MAKGYAFIIIDYIRVQIMNRCQHGQKITYFCLADSCNHKEASACPTCLKKYHAHSSKSQAVQVTEVVSMMEKLILPTDIKPRCRVIQQSIHDYLAFLKTQFSMAADALSRNMMNRLSSPFIFHSGCLQTYQKFKMREYRKMDKAQVSGFVDLLRRITANQQSVREKERSYYHQEADQALAAIEQVHQIFLELGRVFKGYETEVDSGESLYGKIIQDNNTRLQQSPTASNKKTQKSHKFRVLRTPNLKSLHSSHQNSPSSPPVDHSKEELIKPQQYSGRAKIRESPRKQKARKISIDVKHQIVPHFQINSDDKGRKRFKDLLQPVQTQSTKPSSAVKQETNKLGTMLQGKKPMLLKVQQSSRIRSKSIQISREMASQQNNSEDLFANLMTQGINIPEMVIEHKALPEPEQKSNYYDRNDELKKKTITIPMKPLPEEDQPMSPLLKKRNSNKNQKQFSLGLKPIDPESKNVLARMPGSPRMSQSPRLQKGKSRQNPDQELPKMLDNEANSVALLTKALPLPPSQAIPLLQLALKQARNNISAAQYLSYLYIEQCRPRECLDLCNRILNKIGYSPEFDQLSVHLNNNKAAALNMLGRYSEAISILGKIIRLEDNEHFYKNIADAYFSIGIQEKAIINYEKAIKVNKDYDEAYFNMAVCYYSQGNYRSAHQAVLRAQSIHKGANPDYEQFRKNIQIKIK